jgi:hypothetical protein
MWIQTRARTENDKRSLVNVEHYATISQAQLGDRWFIDAVLSSDTATLATVDSEGDARAIVQAIFDALKNGDTAIDLNALSLGG